MTTIKVVFFNYKTPLEKLVLIVLMLTSTHDRRSCILMLYRLRYVMVVTYLKVWSNKLLVALKTAVKERVLSPQDEFHKLKLVKELELINRDY